MQQCELMRHTIDAFELLKVPYAIVGSMASGVWGEPRMTLDIDVVARFGNNVDRFCELFPDDQFYVSVPAAEEAVRRGSQFNVIDNLSSQKIDVMTIADSPWSQSQLWRRRLVELIEGVEGYVAAPEDVVLGKLLYYRDGQSEKHLRDIRGIFAASGEIIDREYLEQWVARLDVVDAWGDARKWLEG